MILGDRARLSAPKHRDVRQMLCGEASHMLVVRFLSIWTVCFWGLTELCGGGGSEFRGAESMVMNFHGNARGEVRVNFLALFASKPTFSFAVPSNCPELFARTFA